MTDSRISSDQMSTKSDQTSISSSSQESMPVLTPVSTSSSGAIQPTQSSSNTNVEAPGATFNPSDLSSSVTSDSNLTPVQSIASSLSDDAARTPTPTPPSTPALTSRLASATSEAPWIPTRTSGTVTVETVTYSFNFLDEPPPRPEKDGKPSSEQTHVDFLAVVPKMKSAASIFDGLGSAFKTFSSAVHAPDASDKSVSTAGSGLLGLFHSGFSAAADIGGTLGSIGLSEIDNGGKILNRFKQTSLSIFDLGETIQKIEPLLGSNLNLPNANTLLEYTSDISKGISIGEGLKDLAELANEVSDSQPTPDTTPTPESTNVQSTPDPSTQSSPTTSQFSSTTSSSSSSSSSAAETLKPYSISTKIGTSPAAFDAFVKSLPDAGQGIRIEYPNVPWQVYGTEITDSLAASLRLNPILRAVVYDPFIDDDREDYSVIPKTLEKRVDPDPYLMLNLALQPVSPAHLNLISQGPKNAATRRTQTPPPEIPDYLMSPKAGEGTTIFVIDTGIDPSHPDFVNSYTPGEHYIVPNSKLGLPKMMANPDKSSTQALVPYVPDPDTVMSDSKDHGNCVASLATGKVYGVAKRAKLYPVKFKNSKGAATDKAIQDAFMHVIDVVVNRDSGANGPAPTAGWAVLNFSQGFGHLKGKEWEERRRLMTDLLNECWKHDIVTVIAAGNEGEEPSFDLSQDIPGCIGTPTNPLITVGACNQDGSRTAETNRDRGRGGSITTSAMGDDAVRCVARGTSGSQRRHGTSVAAPQVAGLAAYFLSLPRAELPEAIHYDTQTPESEGRTLFLGPSLTGGKFIGPDLHIKGTVAQAVKDYIVRMSYKRNPANADAVNVAYNGVEEGLCSVVLPNASFKRKREGLVRRAEGDLVPVVVSGVMQSTATYPMPSSCALPSASSSSSSSSSSSASSAISSSAASTSSLISTSSTSSVASESSSPPPTPVEASKATPAAPLATPTPTEKDEQWTCHSCIDGDIVG